MPFVAATPELRAVYHAALGVAKVVAFESLNRTYESFVNELAPIELGSARIELVSPEHFMTLERHEASLRPLGEGRYEVRVEAQFHGGGLLSADILIGAVPAHLEDELTLPSQVILLEGQLRVIATPEGYDLVLLAR